jgi:hypothetical protein
MFRKPEQPSLAHTEFLYISQFQLRQPEGLHFKAFSVICAFFRSNSEVEDARGANSSTTEDSSSLLLASPVHEPRKTLSQMKGQ